ncbi:MAG: YbaB/EbfC family nucleoid-associated protein [Thermodesulfobacteriota bacterium]|nr:YbaB/EbfC family nucleoid-associated protein [Thermodesulfobacteriota bacterium]
MTKGFGNIMKQAKMMQEKIGKIQEEMANKTVEASAGGGMITAVINGRQEMVSIKIDPEVVNPNDIEMLEDLVLAAINEGIKRSQEMMAEEMSKITGGMKIPGLT